MQAWPLLPVVRKKLLGEKPNKLSEENPEKDVVYLFQVLGPSIFVIVVVLVSRKCYGPFHMRI